jgi:hypothetical protein
MIAPPYGKSDDAIRIGRFDRAEIFAAAADDDDTYCEHGEDRRKRARDPNQLGKFIVDLAPQVDRPTREACPLSAISGHPTNLSAGRARQICEAC